MHRRASHAFLINRKVFRTSHRRCAASQCVAGPILPPLCFLLSLLSVVGKQLRNVGTLNWEVGGVGGCHGEINVAMSKLVIKKTMKKEYYAL